MSWIDLDHRHVGFLINANHLAAELFAGQETDCDPGRAINHMLIGENVAFGIDDEATPYASRRSTRLASKHVEQGIVRRRIILLVFILGFQLWSHLHCLDIDDRWFDAPG